MNYVNIKYQILAIIAIIVEALILLNAYFDTKN